MTVISACSDINPNDLLGKNVTVKLEQPKGGTRYFNGYVTRFTRAGWSGASSSTG